MVYISYSALPTIYESVSKGNSGPTSSSAISNSSAMNRYSSGSSLNHHSTHYHHGSSYTSRGYDSYNGSSASLNRYGSSSLNDSSTGLSSLKSSSAYHTGSSYSDTNKSSRYSSGDRSGAGYSSSRPKDTTSSYAKCYGSSADTHSASSNTGASSYSTSYYKPINSLNSKSSSNYNSTSALSTRNGSYGSGLSSTTSSYTSLPRAGAATASTGNSSAYVTQTYEKYLPTRSSATALSATLNRNGAADYYGSSMSSSAYGSSAINGGRYSHDNSRNGSLDGYDSEPASVNYKIRNGSVDAERSYFTQGSRRGSNEDDQMGSAVSSRRNSRKNSDDADSIRNDSKTLSVNDQFEKLYNRYVTNSSLPSTEATQSLTGAHTDASAIPDKDIPSSLKKPPESKGNSFGQKLSNFASSIKRTVEGENKKLSPVECDSANAASSSSAATVPNSSLENIDHSTKEAAKDEPLKTSSTPNSLRRRFSFLSSKKSAGNSQVEEPKADDDASKCGSSPQLPDAEVAKVAAPIAASGELKSEALPPKAKPDKFESANKRSSRVDRTKAAEKMQTTAKEATASAESSTPRRPSLVASIAEKFSGGNKESAAVKVSTKPPSRGVNKLAQSQLALNEIPATGSTTKSKIFGAVDLKSAFGKLTPVLSRKSLTQVSKSSLSLADSRQLTPVIPSVDQPNNSKSKQEDMTSTMSSKTQSEEVYVPLEIKPTLSASFCEFQVQNCTPGNTVDVLILPSFAVCRPSISSLAAAESDSDELAECCCGLPEARQNVVAVACTVENTTAPMPTSTVEVFIPEILTLDFHMRAQPDELPDEGAESNSVPETRLDESVLLPNKERRNEEAEEECEEVESVSAEEAEEEEDEPYDDFTRFSAFHLVESSETTKPPETTAELADIAYGNAWQQFCYDYGDYATKADDASSPTKSLPSDGTAVTSTDFSPYTITIVPSAGEAECSEEEEEEEDEEFTAHFILPRPRIFTLSNDLASAGNALKALEAMPPMDIMNELRVVAYQEVVEEEEVDDVSDFEDYDSAEDGEVVRPSSRWSIYRDCLTGHEDSERSSSRTAYADCTSTTPLPQIMIESIDNGELHTAYVDMSDEASSGEAECCSLASDEMSRSAIMTESYADESEQNDASFWQSTYEGESINFKVALSELDAAIQEAKEELRSTGNAQDEFIESNDAVVESSEQEPADINVEMTLSFSMHEASDEHMCENDVEQTEHINSDGEAEHQRMLPNMTATDSDLIFARKEEIQSDEQSDELLLNDEKSAKTFEDEGEVEVEDVELEEDIQEQSPADESATNSLTADFSCSPSCSVVEAASESVPIEAAFEVSAESKLVPTDADLQKSIKAKLRKATTQQLQFDRTEHFTPKKPSEVWAKKSVCQGLKLESISVFAVTIRQAPDKIALQPQPALSNPPSIMANATKPSAANEKTAIDKSSTQPMESGCQTSQTVEPKTTSRKSLLNMSEAEAKEHMKQQQDEARRKARKLGIVDQLTSKLNKQTEVVPPAKSSSKTIAPSATADKEVLSPKAEKRSRQLPKYGGYSPFSNDYKAKEKADAAAKAAEATATAKDGFEAQMEELRNKLKSGSSHLTEQISDLSKGIKDSTASTKQKTSSELSSTKALVNEAERLRNEIEKRYSNWRTTAAEEQKRRDKEASEALERSARKVREHNAQLRQLEDTSSKALAAKRLAAQQLKLQTAATNQNATGMVPDGQQMEQQSKTARAQQRRPEIGSGDEKAVEPQARCYSPQTAVVKQADRFEAKTTSTQAKTLKSIENASATASLVQKTPIKSKPQRKLKKRPTKFICDTKDIDDLLGIKSRSRTFEHFENLYGDSVKQVRRLLSEGCPKTKKATFEYKTFIGDCTDIDDILGKEAIQEILRSCSPTSRASPFQFPPSKNEDQETMTACNRRGDAMPQPLSRTLSKLADKFRMRGDGMENKI